MIPRLPKGMMDYNPRRRANNMDDWNTVTIYSRDAIDGTRLTYAICGHQKPLKCLEFWHIHPPYKPHLAHCMTDLFRGWYRVCMIQEVQAELSWAAKNVREMQLRRR